MANDGGKSHAPPADLHERELQLVSAPTRWVRIYRPQLGPCFFSPDPRNRFSSAALGVLYLGDVPATAFWELFWVDLGERRRGDRRIGKAKLDERVICTARTGRGFQVFDATDARTLNTVSAPSATFSSDYDNCQAWARALFSHPAKPDGILYESARTKGAKCLALFGGRAQCADITWSTATLLTKDTAILTALIDGDVELLE